MIQYPLFSQFMIDVWTLHMASSCLILRNCSELESIEEMYYLIILLHVLSHLFTILNILKYEQTLTVVAWTLPACGVREPWMLHGVVSVGESMLLQLDCDILIVAWQKNEKLWRMICLTEILSLILLECVVVCRRVRKKLLRRWNELIWAQVFVVEHDLKLFFAVVTGGLKQHEFSRSFCTKCAPCM